MIYELRTYTAFPGKFDALLARFRDHTLAAFERNGITNIGYWTERGTDNQITYLIAFMDAEQRAAAWKSFNADQDWATIRKATEPDGPLVSHADKRVLLPTEFSALK